ncbi:dihydrofolate reductase [Jiulongibacter sediminis]|jgi:dihydrofolate reductase|uniref:dihydrofolate reductase n=1 Tax=Jiulongibacter sediminis TaxID=1605367 RepID=UPI0026F29698|nr:dihydrofolate reductase [Jiulongibacter sediminis]
MIEKPKISIIAAMSQNRAIGFKGSLPWPEPIPVDWEHLEKVTKGKKMIMGRKSYEDKHRVSSEAGNFVLSSQDDLELEDNFTHAKSLEEALELCQNEEEIFVIGGEGVFEAALPKCTTLYLTKVLQGFKGDTFFPEFEHLGFQVEKIKRFEVSEQSPYPMEIITYRKA